MIETQITLFEYLISFLVFQRLALTFWRCVQTTVADPRNSLNRSIQHDWHHYCSFYTWTSYHSHIISILFPFPFSNNFRMDYWTCLMVLSTLVTRLTLNMANMFIIFRAPSWKMREPYSNHIVCRVSISLSVLILLWWDNLQTSYFIHR